MTKQITRATERMHSQFEWLDSWHSFSFGEHYDPDRVGFGPLWAVNEDRVMPGEGFPPHPHRDMEIVSIVLDGELVHEDSLGNDRTIRSGDVQYLSAGTGIVHSEFNPSQEKPVHLLQFWIQPQAVGLTPSYAEQPILGETENGWTLIFSPDGRDGSIPIRQDAELYSLQITAGSTVDYSAQTNVRGVWLYLIDGTIEVDGHTLKQSDSLAVNGASNLSIESDQGAKVLLFNLPMESQPLLSHGTISR